MTVQTLAPVPPTRSNGAAAEESEVVTDAAYVASPVGPRPRLTVRDMQLALAAARNHITDADPPSTAHIAAPADLPDEDCVDANTSTKGARSSVESEPWLPEHDGPVSLAGVSAPRARTVRRSAAMPDRTARRPAAKRSPTRRTRTAAIDPTLTALALAAPPRIVVLPACGGAGATTATVLLGAALAPVTGALLIAPGDDRGALSVRSGADGGDPDALTAWAARHTGDPLPTEIPGLATGTSGQDTLAVAAAARHPGAVALSIGTATGLFVSPAATTTAVVLDWSTPEPVPAAIRSAATHVLVVAPVTASGLLDAAYAFELLETAHASGAQVSVLTVEVRGRTPRRAGRAALSRLRALQGPVSTVPYDAALADDPRVHWPALRPRTRVAVVAALTELLPAAEPARQLPRKETR